MEAEAAAAAGWESIKTDQRKKTRLRWTTAVTRQSVGSDVVNESRANGEDRHGTFNGHPPGPFIPTTTQNERKGERGNLANRHRLPLKDARLKKKKLDTAADVDVNDKKVNNIMRGSG